MPDAPVRPETAPAFEIEDFKGWLESMHRSEELGEKRIEFFVTFATAVLGAVVLLAKKGDGIDVLVASKLASWALPMLLILGALTFLRMLQRDSRTSQYVHELRKYRARFAGDPPPTSIPPSRPMLNGGLTPLMIAVNAMLLGLWVGILGWRLGYHFNPEGGGLLIAGAARTGLMGFALGWVGGVLYKNRRA